MKPERRCTALCRERQDRCKKPAILGGTVCRSHGGNLPSVRAKANERLANLQHPAIDALDRALGKRDIRVDRFGNLIDAGDDATAQTRAAVAVLDRTGMGPSSTVDVNADASVRLLALIHELDG